MRLEFTGETEIPTIPHTPFGKPWLSVMFVQVSPPSVLFHIAEPSPPLSRLYGVLLIRHVLAYIMRGLFGSKQRSIAPASALANNVRFQVLPPSMDLYTPRSSEDLNRSPKTAA